MVFYPLEQNTGVFGIPRQRGSLIAKELPSDGNWIYSVEVEPTEEPVTVDELKVFARIDYDDEDTLLEGFLKAVRQAAEDYTGRKFVEQTIMLQMDFWPGRTIELPVCPVLSITKVGTLDESDVETEYSSDYYYLVKGKTLNKLALKQDVTEPINTDRDYGGFFIRFKAGYGAASQVPDAIKTGIMQWASIVQSNREIDPRNPPPEARVFLDLYKTISVMVR